MYRLPNSPLDFYTTRGNCEKSAQENNFKSNCIRQLEAALRSALRDVLMFPRSFAFLLTKATHTTGGDIDLCNLLPPCQAV